MCGTIYFQTDRRAVIFALIDVIEAKSLINVIISQSFRYVPVAL